MEACKESIAKLSPSAAEESVKLIRLPKTNISLTKLPPITDDKVKLPVTEPTSPLVPVSSFLSFRFTYLNLALNNFFCFPQLQAAYTSQKPFQGIKQSKEPRFVPYEPYKAAITPLTCNKKKHSKGNSGEKIKQEINDDVDAAATKVNVTKTVDVEDNKVKQEMEEKYKKELNSVKAKLDDAEKALRIQIQVNSEVKKLLVASVGEDIEAKVDFLTQDKARLAADITQYSNKISRDFEEKEKLSVESDLWKSKFLASSVIVDELARWKGIEGS